MTSAPLTSRAQRVVVGFWLAYLVAVLCMRTLPGLLPWSAETDWKQWLWIYHRFSTPGAFPAGQLLTDYAFVVQPPAYLAAAAFLSWLTSPVIAATLLYALALAGALACAWWAGSARVPAAAALLCAVLVAHDHAFFKHTVGGYPRSFGPALTLLFLASWMHRKHALTVATLVLMAALYPSVVVPCGLAYGAWSVLLAGRAGFLRRNGALLGAGVLIVVLSELQSLRAPSWWGGVVSLAEAAAMPALGPQGRTPWVPLPGYWAKVSSSLLQTFRADGAGPVFGAMPWTAASVWLLPALVMACALFLVVRARRAGKSWRAALAELPMEPLLLVVGALVAFLAARAFAFKLYLPHRVVQHVLPYATATFAGIVVVRAVAALWPSPAGFSARRLFALPALFLLLAGDGLYPYGLRSYAVDAPLYQYLEQHTPLQGQIAGNLKILDEVPFFSKRQVFVNWKMAHPFRKGFYAEIERRILAMYDAYYATDVKGVLAFCEAEHIDTFIVDTALFDEVEKGDGQLFEPLRSQVVERWQANREQGFVLLGVPDEAVVFRHGSYRVVDVARLRAWAQTHPEADLRVKPATPRTPASAAPRPSREDGAIDL